MADQGQLDLLKQGVDAWNQWRREHTDVIPDLSGADLSGMTLSGMGMIFNGKVPLSFLEERLAKTERKYRIERRYLLVQEYSKGINLSLADLRGANLRETDLRGANLSFANLRGANLWSANLYHANLSHIDLSTAHLEKADLGRAILIEANLAGANLSNSFVYGVSAWDTNLQDTVQSDLIITRPWQPVITVDNLKVAQFIYLLLKNEEIRDVIDTITSQVVLILGRFPNERKMHLEALRGELRNQNYWPVAFNLEETDDRDFTETVKTLANMARFVLIDLTDLGNLIHELADAIVPRCIVPIRPLFHIGSRQQEYERFRELQQKHRWVLAPYRYKDLPDLYTSFQENILQPIYEKLIELKQKRPPKMFLGYAPEDKNMLKILKTHLRSLERAGLIEMWDDQDVAPGEEKGKAIERHLSTARIILLLISPAFLNSDDCYDILMSMAIERYKQGEAKVIPILLSPCAWQSTPLKELQPLPKDGKPISKHNKNDVFFEMSEDIGDVIKILG